MVAIGYTFRPFMRSSSEHLMYKAHADAIQTYLHGEDWYLSLLHKRILCVFLLAKSFEGSLGVARKQQSGILARNSQWLYGLWKYSTDVLSTCMYEQYVTNCRPCAMNNNYFVCCVRQQFSINPLSKNIRGCMTLKCFHCRLFLNHCSIFLFIDVTGFVVYYRNVYQCV